VTYATGVARVFEPAYLLGCHLGILLLGPICAGGVWEGIDSDIRLVTCSVAGHGLVILHSVMEHILVLQQHT
jgi:hypothetical protein